MSLPDRGENHLLIQVNTCGIQREHLFFCPSFLQRYMMDIVMEQAVGFIPFFATDFLDEFGITALYLLCCLLQQ